MRKVLLNNDLGKIEIISGFNEKEAVHYVCNKHKFAGIKWIRKNKTNTTNDTK